jgi:GT2 family glycosyltransferase
MKLSYVIITRNRREALLRTLECVRENTPLARRSWEVIVVDNASDDGSAEAVAKQFRGVRMICLNENEGMPARNHGFREARGRYVCMLDDDSYPTGDAIPKSVAYLERHPKTAAVVGRVELPNGECEGPALPCVLLGGASVVRKSVLDATGGFAPEFFRQAEEYDLSFRILRGGHRIERFEDVVFRHEKAPGGRSSALTHRMDLRNNLILVERYLPKSLRRYYRYDWIRRYSALARHDGHGRAVRQAMHEALVWARRERTVGRQTLDDATVEAVLGLRAQAESVDAWAKANNVRRVVVADFSKNIYATYAACGLASLEIGALLDHRSAFAGMTYRGLRIAEYTALPDLAPDGVIVSNINPSQVESRARLVRQSFQGPVLTLWHPKFMEPPAARAA